MSGFYLVKSDGLHQSFPVRGSYRSEKTGQQPAKLMDAGCYPIVGECHWCHGPIRLATRNQMEWVHAAAPAPSAGDAS